MRSVCSYFVASFLWVSVMGCDAASSQVDGGAKSSAVSSGSVTVESSDLAISSGELPLWQATIQAEQDFSEAANGHEVFVYKLMAGAQSPDNEKSLGVHVYASSLGAFRQGASYSLAEVKTSEPANQADAKVDGVYYVSQRGHFVISSLEAGQLAARLDADFVEPGRSDEAGIVASFQGALTASCSFVQLSDGAISGDVQAVGLEDPRCAALFEN